MLYADGKESVGVKLKLLAVSVLCPDMDFLGPLHLGAELRYREATLVYGRGA